MQREQRKQVKEFKKEYGIKKVTSETLCSAINDLGYTVVKFNGISDDEDTQTIIDSLNLKYYTSNYRGFTYQDSKHRLVFYNEDLNEAEKKIVLSHELGHICNKHLFRNNVFGEDIIQEHEANEFSHYLLKDNKKRNIVIAIICALVIVAGGIAVSNYIYTDIKYTKNFYVTDNGAKYHLKNCMYVKNRKNVRRMTKKEFKSKKYKPCEACMPDEKIK